MDNKLLKTFLISFFVFSFKSASISALPVPIMSPDIRHIINNVERDALESEDCCPALGNRYILRSGVGKNVRQLSPLFDLPSSELNFSGKPTLLYQGNEFNVKGYYVLDSTKTICIAEALFEKINTGFKPDIDRFLRNQGFNLSNTITNSEINIPSNVTLKIYEKITQGNIQRYVVGDFLTPIQSPENEGFSTPVNGLYKLSYILAETFYSLDMDGIFHPILVEYLNSSLSGM